MSATPESFIDQIDADVPNDAETTDNSAKEGTSAVDSKAKSIVESGGAADNAKDKLDPAKLDDKAEKVVPLKALQEEREAAKQLKARIAELEAEPKLTAEEKQQLADLKAQKAKPKDIDFLDDPKGYIDAKTQAALDKLKAVDEKADAVNSAVTQQQQYNALLGAITASETAFVAATPDYYEALNHVRSVRGQQIKLMDDTISDQAVSQLVAQEELQAAAAILRKNGDPCQFAYNYAKTLGYAKKAPAGGIAEAAAAADKSAVRTMGSGGSDAAAADEADSDDPNAEFQSIRAAFRKR